MAKKKNAADGVKKKPAQTNVQGLRAETVEQPITETLEQNYMPYAMSVIVSRAIPEIDGFKPSHRKLLYTMYKMGLLTGERTKSANIVGQTMKLNPHGDAAIYDTMVRLSKGNESLLMPFVDSKGNFGKVYSRDMACAASRYTEARLAPICAELFRDIDKDTVDFEDNYDGTMKEPTLLPTAFPNVLVSANTGIAVGMASAICGFDLCEVCRTTVAFLRDEEHDLLTTLPAPDFPTGGELLYDPAKMREIYRTGRGSFQVRARWRYLSTENLIEVYELPYTTTVEAVIDKLAELMKAGKLREVSDVRDETDLSGLKLAIDLKRGTDPDRLMQKLFRSTPLQDSYGCNFNILISGYPRVMGVREILTEWTAWREECIRRRVFFELQRKKEKLHLLRGLAAILLDIDRAIAVIRETEREADVVPNLMIDFGIDQVQAEYVAEIRLRNINREYILKRTDETASLERDIEEMEQLLASRRRIRNVMIRELEEIMKKYPTVRHTGLVEPEAGEAEPEGPEAYPVTLFLSRSGYFKKITPQSLRMNAEQRYKDDDGPMQRIEATNAAELLVFTDRQQVYKTRVCDFPDGKASALGTYLPSQLGMDEGERVFCMVSAGDWSGELLLFFADGKCARIPLSAYATKTNRRRLTGAYSDKSPLRAVVPLTEGDTDIAVRSTEGRTLVFSTALLAPKASRTTQGVGVMTLKPKYQLETAVPLQWSTIRDIPRYRVKTLPAAGALLREADRGEEQLSLMEE
ncbi:MAG: DNA topoisomerase (ATP-hydrolyzing) subunit A [Clostridiales bacterium]|nr:DNA topoisomerase (ATP-hydrolyzing) subunit A [Clostridiales bacterium]